MQIVDGNAYYWSSVNPDTFPGYPEKLIEMGEAVHENMDIWIAPAAPGFDARLVGGTIHCRSQKRRHFSHSDQHCPRIFTRCTGYHQLE